MYKWQELVGAVRGADGTNYIYFKLFNNPKLISILITRKENITMLAFSISQLSELLSPPGPFFVYCVT